MLLAAFSAAPRPAEQRPLAPTPGRSYSLHQLNQLYEEGRPSNDPLKAGLMVHQHDNTEGWNGAVYRPQGVFAQHWSTSIISRKYPGTYNRECGIVLDPEAVAVECSFYKDMVSWSGGCKMIQSGSMDHPPSKARGVPYPPDQLKNMLEMSAELQQRGVQDERLRTSGNGEPDPLTEKNGRTFWQGQYNEVIVNPKTYLQRLPQSVLAVFFVNASEGGDPAGENCARATRTALANAYEVDMDQIPIVVYAPDAKSMHAFTALPEPEPSGPPPSCPKCAQGNNCCSAGGSWFNTCGSDGDGSSPKHTWDQGWAACNCAGMSPTEHDWKEKCARFGFTASEPKEGRGSPP